MITFYKYIKKIRTVIILNISIVVLDMGQNQGCTKGGASDGATPDSRVQGAA